ncbi:uncharacterized protein [Diadema setosum]|uniref:uncharacterized protein n=1 Tax=Diadema setosum TaxID=31175 RepID=UPI003B3B9230
MHTCSAALLVLIILALISCRGTVYGRNVCGLSITGDNFNVTARWNAAEGENVTYVLQRGFGNPTVLCETSALSCYLGQTILINHISAIGYFFVALSYGECRAIYSSRNVTVGPPDFIEPQIQSRNISVVVRGPGTNLAFEDGKFVWSTSEQDQLYMGQSALTIQPVKCHIYLYNASGVVPVWQGIRTLQRTSGTESVEITKLKPFSEYTIKSGCEINHKMSTHLSTFKFTTLEEVPSSGPSLLKLSSSGQGCEDRDKRNITLSIQPPKSEDHNGILTFYEIRYCLVPEGQGGRNWTPVILPVPSPVPPFTEVVLADLSRWDAYEVMVYANNSKGGAPSSVHTVDPLKPKEGAADSRPANKTTREISPNLWLLEWLPPWSRDTRDCIMNYAVQVDNRHVATVNTSSYRLDLDEIGTSGDTNVKINAMIYNGTGPFVKGTPLEISIESDEAGAPKISTITMGVVIAVLVILAVVFAMVFLHYGPRVTESFDMSNNRILKSAKTMGEQHPKAPPEKEEFDVLLNLPPPHHPESGDEVEETSLITTSALPPITTQATSQPPTPLETSPASSRPSNRSNSSAGDSGVPMETERGETSSDEEGHGTAFAPLLTRDDSRMSCSEDSLISSPAPSSGSSGYVSYPPLNWASLASRAKEGSPSVTHSAHSNNVCPVAVDVTPRSETEVVFESVTVDNCKEIETEAVPESLTVEAVGRQLQLKLQPEDGTKLSAVRACKAHYSPDSEGTNASLSPSDAEMSDGVDSYTKLSRPNTPLSPRSQAQTDPEPKLWAKEWARSAQELPKQTGLSNVG